MEFSSAVNAVEAAVELQAKMAEANQSVTEHRRILLRIGINLGDVIGEGSDIYGDGVNIAARLEALAEPGGVCVSAKVHEELRGKGDAAFEDMGEVELKNIVRPVRVYRVGTSTGQVGGRAATTSTARPSIAVLPFDNLSGDPSQQYLSDGITEDITTELSRFRNLTVAARHASFHLARMGINPMQAARDLGANYVIEGSVRKAGERIRITAQLIDARTGNHVWAERYDRECHDIFAVQDEVVAAIVTTLEGRMVAAAALQVRKRPTSSWTAYDFFLQGRELADANMEKEAVPLFSRATAIDPDFAHAHAWLAIALLGRYWFDTDPRNAARSVTCRTKSHGVGQQRSDGPPRQRHGHGVAPRIRTGRHPFRPRHRSQSGRCANSRGPSELVAIRRPAGGGSGFNRRRAEENPVSTTLVLGNSRQNFVGTEEIWRSRSGLGQHAKKGSRRLAHTGGRP